MGETQPTPEPRLPLLHSRDGKGIVSNKDDARNLQIIATPTIEWLSQNARECRSRMLIASPYVNRGIMELTNLASRDVKRTLITRTDLRDFAMGASDLETLRILERDGVRIRSLIGLHAKIYIFDSASALVTSANATYSGMHRNWECGLGTTDASVVVQLSKYVLRGLGADRPPRKIEAEDLDSIRTALATIKTSIPQPSRLIEPATTAPAPEPVFSIADEAELLAGFRGWLRLTLRGVIQMPRSSFRLQDLLSVCAPLAAQEYPKNYHVSDKLRQQLQELRDLGIVEFVSPGIYRRTLETNFSE